MKILIFRFFFILSCLLLISCNKKLVNEIIKDNINDFSSGSCYIHVDVQFLNNKYTIVVTNTTLYSILKHKQFGGNLSETDYTKIISKAIRDQNYIKINESSDSLLRYSAVQKSLIDKYKKLNIIDSGYILPNGLLSDSIDYENEKAIIYTLLENKTRNCCQNSESGETIIFSPRPVVRRHL